MCLINLTISLFSILKVKTLECVSVVNQKCIPRPEILDVNEGVCKLNSSVCNNKKIWNSDTCRCDCIGDFAGIISCDKGYTWNPSTCECQCDM